MTNKITFIPNDGTVQFQSVRSGECFTYATPASDQVYMKVMHDSPNLYGCVSLKTGQFYQMKPDKLVRPVSIEVVVTESDRRR